MKIAGICFTQAGFSLLQWIQEILQKKKGMRRRLHVRAVLRRRGIRQN